MSDEARPIDSGLQQADIAVEHAETEKAQAAKEKRKDKTLHLKEPAKPEPEAEIEQASDAEQIGDDNGDSAGDEGEQQPPTNPGKKKTPIGVQKKLDKLTREKYERDARIAYLERQAEERQQQADPKPEGKPTLAQFNGDQEQYLDALSDWKVESKLADIEKRKLESERQHSENEKVAAYYHRLQGFMETHPDWKEVAERNPINYSDTMLDFIKESELGPQIGYYLGQNVDEGLEISQMPPMRQAIALDRIERGLAEPEEIADEPPPRRTITKAPPPPATIVSGGSAKRSITDANLTPAERIAMWRRKKAG